MDLTHNFTVPATVPETWAAFNDIESVAGCFPGATVTSVEGDAFKGSCKVKLGPIALVYSGSGTFLEKDEGAGRMVIDARGKDKRGNGTAGANVVVSLSDAGDGRTGVEVVTDLAITGKPAQFGRGVIQDVSDKLLQQFVDCLEKKVSSPDGDADPTPESATDPAASAVGASAVAGDASVEPVETPSGRHAAPPSRPATEPDSNDALDLGATVIPILLKSYGKQLAGGLAAVLALILLVRRRRR